MIATSLHDRESAGTKSLIQSYVDVGHDLVSAEDVADALKYGSGVKHSAVLVVSIKKSHKNSKDQKFSFL